MCSFRFSPAPTPQKEPALEHGRCGRRGMGDDGWMRADERTGHPRAHAQPAGHLGDGAEHAPHERGLALGRDPWMEVVRDERKVETALLGLARQLDQLARPISAPRTGRSRQTAWHSLQCCRPAGEQGLCECSLPGPLLEACWQHLRARPGVGISYRQRADAGACPSADTLRGKDRLVSREDYCHG